ncbi:MAG TPA: hypothetical protein VEH10_03840, partial [Thermoplasmata archaeon]|nr:hypothetical protein [Thermoplasmata archaeon]
MRTVERLEGLALGGGATVGPVRFRIPAVLEARAPGEVGEGPFVSAGPSAAGARRIVVGDRTGRFEVELPVLAPEITPTGSGVFAVGTGTVLLHA